MAVRMANGPPFATLNHVAADLGIPNESEPLRVGISQDAVERAVKQIRDGRPKDEEQSQATRLMAIGFAEGVKLWHSPDGQGHASVLVDGHWEHYRIKSNAFEGWLRGEYGRVNQVKVGDRR